MTAVRTLVQVSLLAACAATSFVSAQVYMVAKEEMTQPVGSVANADPIAAVLADSGDLDKAIKPDLSHRKVCEPAAPSSEDCR